MRCGMKKKILLLGLFAILLSGCSVDYSVTIDTNTIDETIEIQANESDASELEYYENSKQNEFTSFYNGTDHFYQTSFDDSLHRFTLSYEYYDTVPYSLSSAFHDCFSSSSIVTNEDKVTIKASGFICYNYNYTNLEELAIHVTVNDYDVLTHNATSREDNVYSWEMQNGQFPDIELVLQEQVINEPSDNPEEEACNLTCPNGEELVNPDREDCYCRVIETTQEEDNTLFDYILLSAVLILFVIAIIGLIKYKSIHD